MSTKNKIAEYEEILSRIYELDSSEGKDLLINMVKRLIRTEEIADYRQRYFNNGYYFGFILMQSQVYEFALRSLIENCEVYIDLTKSGFKKYQYFGNKLDRLTLGELVNKPFLYYIKYPELFDEIVQFNKLRKDVIHHLVGNLDIGLTDLEGKIKLNHITNFYSNIENMIHAASTNINNRIGKIKNPKAPYMDIILHKLLELNPIKNPLITYTFDK